MVIALQSRPSFSQGYATPQVGGLAYPSLWRGVVGAWAPSLGATGLTLRDHSGKANHGTLTNFDLSAAWGDPAALTFDGTDDHVTAGTIDISDWREISVSAWVKYDGIGTDEHSIVSNWGSNAEATILFRVEPATDTLELFVVTQTNTLVSVACTDLAVAVDEWSHVVAVYSPQDGLTAYVDGQKSGISTAYGAALDSTPAVSEVYLGNTPHSTSDDFGGGLDDVVLRDRVPTANEIAELYRLGPGGIYRRQQFTPVVQTVAGANGTGIVRSVQKSRPSYSQGMASPETGGLARPDLWRGVVGAWAPSLGATGLVLRDHSGKANHGTLTNFTLSDAWSDPAGLTFDATDDYIASTSSAGAFSSGQSFAVSAWIKIISLPSNNASVMVKGYGTAGQVQPWWLLLVDGAGAIGLQTRNAAAATATATGGDVSDGEWHFITGVYNATAATLTTYIDAASVATASSVAAGAYGTNASNLEFGGSHADRYYAASQDDMRIYNRALTASQIAELYRLGPGGIYRRQQFNPVVSTEAAAGGLGIPFAAYHQFHNVGSNL